MKNFVQPGNIIPYEANSNVSSGDVVALGNRIGIAITDIASGKTGSVALEGVYELDAVTDTAFSQGDDLYWDAGTKKLTKTASTNKFAGMCWESKSQTASSAKVRLSDAVAVESAE